MGIMRAIYGMFKKEKGVFTALLQPKEIVGRGLCPKDAKEFYEPFIKGLEGVIGELYGEFKHTESSKGRGMTHNFVGDDFCVTYSTAPTVSQSPDGDDVPTIYRGILSVEQYEIDLETVCGLLKGMKPLSLLACRNQGDFQVSCKQGKYVLDGDELLAHMKLTYDEGCEYFVFPGVVAWRYVKLGGEDES